MAGKQEKKKPRGEKMSNTEPDRHDLSFEFIQTLGGTKEDLRLLADCNDDAEDLDLAGEGFDTEPIKKDEVRSFMEGLGIFEHRPDMGGKEKKAKKLLKAPVDDDDNDDESTAIETAAAVEQNQPGEKKKKKEKNKFKAKEAEEAESSALQEKKEKKQKKEDKMKKKDDKEGKKKGKKQEAATESSKKDNESEKKGNKKEKNKFKVQHNEVSSSTSIGREELKSHLNTHPQRPYLLVKAGDTWLDHQTRDGAEEVTTDLIHRCEQFAAKLLEDEVTLYKKQREKTKKGESNWIKTVLTSGTLTDKMAALTLLVQESPTHNMAALESLVTMAKKKGKREAMMAADALKNLFVSDSSPLPDDRKLIAFDARPVSSLWHACSGNKDSVDKRLVVWYAEDLLRQKYTAFVKAMDTMSYDTVLATKEKALAVIHTLMVSKPEQEDALLPMLVNKLGDPSHKIASKASYLLLKLVEQHPNMKSVIAAEVERLVYRPNVAQRAQYYAMCFLNQIKLHKADQSLATKLIGIFFSFFKMYVTKGEVDSKMMAALLTGVNRAYPFAKLEQDFLSEQMSTLYKIVHIVNFNTSVQALMLLHQVVDPSNSDSDRYFMALYRKMLDPALRTSAKQAQFLNLLYKSLKADLVQKRVKAVLKRLLQAGCLLGPNYLCGALIVVSEVMRERPGLLAVRQLGKSTKKIDVNDAILRKAAGKDEVDAENKLFADDLDDDDDEEEKFVDVPLPAEFQEEGEEVERDAATESDEGEETNKSKEAEEGTGSKTQPKGSSWVHRHNLTGGSKTQPKGSSWVHRHNLTGKSEKGGYSPYQRNPLHCQAENECLWELESLTRHYHPSVSLFARTILQGKPVVYSGDPLQDFTLIRFLDRFVYKNPKKKETGDGKSETVGSSSVKREKSADHIAVNSAEFLEGGEEAVPEHEKYLYKYFSQRAEKKKKEEEEEESDGGSVSDSEFDDFLDKHERQLDDGDLDAMDYGIAIASEKELDEADSDDEDGGGGGLSDEEMDMDMDDDLAAEFRREMEALEEADDDGEDGSDDEEVDLDDDDDDLDDEEGDDFDDEDDDDDLSEDELKGMMLGAGGTKKRKKGAEEEEGLDFDMPPGRKKKRSRHQAIESMFASADDFADVLEGNAEGEVEMLGTLDAVSNTDKASAKQIAWEADRDKKTQGKGKDWRQNKRKGNFKPRQQGGRAGQGGNSRGNASRGNASRRNQGGKKRK